MTITRSAISDVSAILKHTQKVVYLDDHEMATVYRDKFVTKTVDNVTTSKQVHEVDWDLEQIEKGSLFHMIRRSGVARRRTDATITFPDEFFIR